MEKRSAKEDGESRGFYRFVSLYQDYMNQTRDYGDGVQHSMIEMHILTIVCNEPGITVGQVARHWGRTKGAASQNATKLEKQGLLVRAKHLNNGREVHLYPTEKGKELARLHAEYDERTEAFFARQLLSRCTEEELAVFGQVMDVYSDLIEEYINSPADNK